MRHPAASGPRPAASWDNQPVVSPPLEWSIEPSVVVGVVVLCACYGWLWRRARRPGTPHRPGYGRLALFAASMVAVVLALLSPLDSISDHVFFMHMAQHLLLLDVIPVLMILSLTKTLMRPVTRRLMQVEQAAGLFATPAFAVFAYVVVIYAWHVPAMYDLAVEHSGIHACEHLCFGVVGTLFWWHLLSPIPGRRHLEGMQVGFYVGTAKVFIGALGIGLTFLTTCIYPWYLHQPHYWGITPRVGQNLGGAVMALEQSVVMGIAFAYVLIKALGDSERKARRQEGLASRPPLTQREANRNAMAAYRTALAAARERQQTERSHHD